MAIKTITMAIQSQMYVAAKRKAGITDELNKIEIERRELAEACALYACGGQEVIDKALAVQAQIDELHEQMPEVLRRKESRLHYAVGSGGKSANIGGMRVVLQFAWDRGIPCPEEITIPGDHPLAQQFHELEAREKAAKGKANSIDNALRAALIAAGRNVKKLLQVWPEAAELLPEEAAPVNLPVVQAADLNKMIGLPSTNTKETTA